MVESEDFDCEEQSIRHSNLRNELGLSMVIISESTDFPIFPPINHENLYIDVFKSPSESSSPSSSSRLSDSSSSSSLSPSDSDEQFEFDRNSHSQPSETVGKSRWKSLYYSILDIDIVQGWWKLHHARILSNFQKLVTCFSRYSLSSLSRSLRSYYPVIFILIWWWMRNRTRRRLREGEIAAHLRDTIKERDEVGILIPVLFFPYIVFDEMPNRHK